MYYIDFIVCTVIMFENGIQDLELMMDWVSYNGEMLAGRVTIPDVLLVDHVYVWRDQSNYPYTII